MNVTGFSDNNNDRPTFTGIKSVKLFNDYDIFCDKPPTDSTEAYAVVDIILYVVYALGIPGNILSAIVWLRRHVTSENSSAIYLAASAIDDLVWLIFDGVDHIIFKCYHGFASLYCYCFRYLIWSTAVLEPLLVLGFSVVRLIAIRRPLGLQVRCIMKFTLT